MDWSPYYKNLLALTMWREARGEGVSGMRAVGHVIANRVAATHLPDKWDDIIQLKWQFSAMTAPGDSQLVMWPFNPDSQFEVAMSLSEVIFIGADPDNTNGATHYFNPSVVLPKWAATMTKTCSIGHHDFYK